MKQNILRDKIYYVRRFDDDHRLHDPLYLWGHSSTDAIRRWIEINGWVPDNWVEAMNVSDSPYAKERAQ